MKKSLLLICLLSTLGMQAQITISNSVFPAAGDVYLTDIDNDPTAASLTPGSLSMQSWDFSGLVADSAGVDSILSVVGDTIAANNFPSADIKFDSGVLGDAYAEINPSSVDIIGIATSFFGSTFAIPLNNPIVRNFAPVQYGITSNFGTSFAFVTDNPQLLTLIDSAIGALPLVDSADSLRINFNANYEYEVDAWGNLTVPTGTFEVLRINNNQFLDIGLEAWVNYSSPIIPSGWLDLSPFIGAFSPVPLGTDTISNVIFQNDMVKEPICDLSTNLFDNSITSAKYTREIGTVSVETLTLSNSLTLFPNPASTTTTLQTAEFPEGQYTIAVMDAMGRTVKSEGAFIASNDQIVIDVQNLPGGFYWTRLINEAGEHVASKILVVER